MRVCRFCATIKTKAEMTQGHTLQVPIHLISEYLPTISFPLVELHDFTRQNVSFRQPLSKRQTRHLVDSIAKSSHFSRMQIIVIIPAASYPQSNQT